MKLLVIYSSQTGFTKQYAQWIAEVFAGDTMTIKDANKKKDDFFEQYDALVYGGFAMAGSINKVKWFLEKANRWREKKLAVYCVGASPDGAKDIEIALHNALTDEQREYMKAFYCPGGLNYENMPGPSKLAMRAFASVMRKKKDKTEDEKVMAEMIQHSYDIHDIKYIKPIVEYLKA